jgi:hypothetical protein
MRRSSKLARAVALMALVAPLLVVSSRGVNATAARTGQDAVARRATESTLTPEAFLPFVARTWPFVDEFDGNELDLTKWDVITGTPTVGDGKLVLPGGATRAEVQSKAHFQYGVLQAAIQSFDWVMQAEVTDSSLGFETWTGANGKCHYGVVLIANGHLGVLRSQPDANDNCFGDPEYQEYPPISSWDAVRAAGAISLTLTWSPDGTTLCINGGGSSMGQASYAGQALPAIPLKIRLNSDIGETYLIDYVKARGHP